MSIFKKIKNYFKTDGYSNAVSGIGHATQDKAMFSSFLRPCELTCEELQNMYSSDAIVARICNTVPRESLRQGYEIKAGKDNQSALNQIKAIENKLNQLGANNKLQEAMIWARVFGGAVVYMGINDGKAESSPVDFNKIKEVNFLTVLDRRDLVPHTYYDDPLSEKFNDPKTYKVVSVGKGGTENKNFNVEIHESRLLVFEGSLTPRREKARNNGWATSFIQRIEPALKQYLITVQSLANLMQDAYQGMFKIRGYMDMVSAADTSSQNAPWIRYGLIDKNRSMARSVILDAENEEFQRDNISFGSMPEVLDRMYLNLSAYTGIPVTFLMGQSPSGLNATGESDIRIFYDQVKAMQISDLQPKLERLILAIMSSKLGPTGGREIRDWRIEFNPLWQPNEKEVAETRKLRAEADQIDVMNGFASAEEIRNSRFGSGKYSLETNITGKKITPPDNPNEGNENND